MWMRPCDFGSHTGLAPDGGVGPLCTLSSPRSPRHGKARKHRHTQGCKYSLKQERGHTHISPHIYTRICRGVSLHLSLNGVSQGKSSCRTRRRSRCRHHLRETCLLKRRQRNIWGHTRLLTSLSKSGTLFACICPSEVPLRV